MPTVLKSGNLNLLEPSGPLQACNGIALPLPLPLPYPVSITVISLILFLSIEFPIIFLVFVLWVLHICSSENHLVCLS